MWRLTLIELVEKLPTCVIAMEARCGAHHLDRLFTARGTEYVRPYVKAQKNDDRDAEGIAEAASRPTMRFVELKRERQLDIQTVDISPRRIGRLARRKGALGCDGRLSIAVRTGHRPPVELLFETEIPSRGWREMMLSSRLWLQIFSTKNLRRCIAQLMAETNHVVTNLPQSYGHKECSAMEHVFAVHRVGRTSADWVVWR